MFPLKYEILHKDVIIQYKHFEQKTLIGDKVLNNILPNIINFTLTVNTLDQCLYLIGG